MRHRAASHEARVTHGVAGGVHGAAASHKLSWLDLLRMSLCVQCAERGPLPPRELLKSEAVESGLGSMWTSAQCKRLAFPASHMGVASRGRRVPAQLTARWKQHKPKSQGWGGGVRSEPSQWACARSASLRIADLQAVASRTPTLGPIDLEAPSQVACQSDNCACDENWCHEGMTRSSANLKCDTQCCAECPSVPGWPPKRERSRGQPVLAQLSSTLADPRLAT